MQPYLATQRYQKEQRKLKTTLLKHPVSLFRAVARAKGLTQWQTNILIHIADCENTTWDSQAQNPISTAAGIFQITHGTWLDYSPYPWSQRYDMYDNMVTAIFIYQARGTEPWVCRVD